MGNNNTYNLKSKTVAIVCASEFNHQHFKNKYDSECFDKIIAADGGFKHLNKLNICPDICIGDFDSLGYVPESMKNMSVVRYPCEKDYTDLELCVEEAIKQNADCIAIYGALGKRLDHEMGTIQMLSRISEDNIQAYAVGIQQAAAVVNGPGELCISIKNGKHKTVSVFSLSHKSTNINSSGLKWPYKNTSLSNTMSLGISNVVTDDKFSISVESGKLLIIFDTLMV